MCLWAFSWRSKKTQILPECPTPARCVQTLWILQGIPDSTRQLCWHNQIPPSVPVLGWAHLLYGSALSNGSCDTWLPSRHLLWHLWSSLGWIPWVSMERGPDTSLRSRTASAKPRTSLFRLPAELPENQNKAFSWSLKRVFHSLILWTGWNRWQYPSWLLPSKMRSPSETWHCHFQNKFWLKGESVSHRTKQVFQHTAVGNYNCLRLHLQQNGEGNFCKLLVYPVVIIKAD